MGQSVTKGKTFSSPTHFKRCHLEGAFWATRRSQQRWGPQHLYPQWEGAVSRPPLEGAPLAGLGHVSAPLRVLGNLTENTAFPVMK